jgi:hypothetical protein
MRRPTWASLLRYDFELGKMRRPGWASLHVSKELDRIRHYFAGLKIRSTTSALLNISPAIFLISLTL